VSDQICRICGQPLERHQLMLWQGVAHTVVRDEQGRVAHHCSRHAGEGDYFNGQVQILQSIVRSLRNRAGRLRTLGRSWSPDDLDEYSNKLADDIERLQGYLEKYY
jgi:hypothetical protein